VTGQASAKTGIYIFTLVINGQGQELLMQSHYLMATLDRIIHFMGRKWNVFIVKAGGTKTERWDLEG
jgi:hypothetical protein